MNNSMIPLLVLNNKDLPNERKMFYMMLGQSLAKANSGSAMLPFLMAQQEGADLVARKAELSGLQSKINDLAKIVDQVIDEDLSEHKLSEEVKKVLRSKFREHLGIAVNTDKSTAENKEEDIKLEKANKMPGKTAIKSSNSKKAQKV